MPKVPVISLISSRPHVPAFFPLASAQFRKDLRHPQKPSSSRWLRRGQRFFRNWAPGQTIDFGRLAGSVQEDAFQGHRHGWIGDAAITSNELTANGGADKGRARQLATIGDPTPGKNGTPRTADETRPVNISQPIILYLGRPAQV